MTIGWVFTIQGCMYALMQIPTDRLVTHQRGKWLALAGIVGMGSMILLI